MDAAFFLSTLLVTLLFNSSFFLDISVIISSNYSFLQYPIFSTSSLNKIGYMLPI